MEKKRIFIIDDDRNSVVAIKDLLQKAGYEVFFAYDGEDGLRKMLRARPHAVLLDLVLPDQSGFKIAQDIKAIAEFADIPIIAISLKNEDIDKHIAAKSGIAGYVEKPIDNKNLLYSIKEALNI